MLHAQSVRKVQSKKPHLVCRVLDAHFWFEPCLAVISEEPECRIDQDCPSKLACIAKTCQNPCSVNNPCQYDQRCVVVDSQPSRSVACICPDGAVIDASGKCSKGDHFLLFYCHTIVSWWRLILWKMFALFLAFDI